jgi:hypothetical protein
MHGRWVRCRGAPTARSLDGSVVGTTANAHRSRADRPGSRWAGVSKRETREVAAGGRALLRVRLVEVIGDRLWGSGTAARRCPGLAGTRGERLQPAQTSAGLLADAGPYGRLYQIRDAPVGSDVMGVRMSWMDSRRGTAASTRPRPRSSRPSTHWTQACPAGVAPGAAADRASATRAPQPSSSPSTAAKPRAGARRRPGRAPGRARRPRPAGTTTKPSSSRAAPEPATPCCLL